MLRLQSQRTPTAIESTQDAVYVGDLFWPAKNRKKVSDIIVTRQHFTPSPRRCHPILATVTELLHSFTDFPKGRLMLCACHALIVMPAAGRAILDRPRGQNKKRDMIELRRSRVMNGTAKPPLSASEAIFSILKIDMIHIDSPEFHRRKSRALGFEAEERTSHTLCGLTSCDVGGCNEAVAFNWRLAVGRHSFKSLDGRRTSSLGGWMAGRLGFCRTLRPVRRLRLCAAPGVTGGAQVDGAERKLRSLPGL
jgi:hypothetical protein